MITEEIRERIYRYLINESDFLTVKDNLNEDQLMLYISDRIDEFCKQKNMTISPEHRNIITRGLVSAVMSLGPIRPLMEDASISEVMINGHKQIYVQRFGKIEKTDVTFGTMQELNHTIQKILASSGSNKRVDESSPYVDFSLPDGSRVNVILPPCSNIGPVMTIRKFNDDIQSVDNIIERGMIDKKIATLLILAMKAKLNVIFSGSTGAGKTTMLNVFSRHIPEEERIITIEDTAELILGQEHVVSLVSKPANIEGKGEITIQDLFVNSLRMRPDRIIIGEVRGPEILDLIQSISSGHSGSLAIVHGESSEDCFSRMVTMMLMTGIRLSTEEIRRQVTKAIDLIVHVELYTDGCRRVSAVTDVDYDHDQKKVVYNNVFEYQTSGVDPQGKFIGDWVHNKVKPTFYSKLKKRMLPIPEGFFEE